MPIDVAAALAESRRAFVIAAAGCGKTETIAQAVGRERAGRQLVLTHTHAGVKALRDRLRRLRVDSRRVHVDTIAGWALTYAASYPQLSGLADVRPTGDAWDKVYEAASRVLTNSVLREVITQSYSGLYVDEYQDCTKKQHRVVMALADLLPCRLLGDPLQGIFGFADPLVEWSTDIEPHFERLPDIETPWRWEQGDPALGRRLTQIRAALVAGDAVDLSSLDPISWRPNSSADQRNVCFEVAAKRGSAVAIHKWPSNCHQFAQGLNGTFTSMEEMDCRDLMRAAEVIERSTGAERALHVLEFATTCMTAVATELRGVRKRLQNGDLPPPVRFRKQSVVVEALARVAREQNTEAIAAALRAMDSVPNRVLFRRELWREMFRALEIRSNASVKTLPEAAWEARNRARRVGRSVEFRTVSRTLLIKGLEFEHAILLDADLLGPKDLYVAMTRGSRSLTVLATEPVLRRERPSW